MAIITKGVKINTPRTSKLFNVGNHVARIVNIQVVNPVYDVKKETFDIKLTLETRPVTEEGFVGMAVDYKNPDGPKYAGQICTVRHSSFSCKTYVQKNQIAGTEKTITAEEQVINFIANIARAIRITTDWFGDTSGKYNTFSEFVAGFMSDHKELLANTYLEFAIGGREYLSKPNAEGKTYTQYDCFLLPYAKGTTSMRNLNDNYPITPFDPTNEKHLKKLAPAKPVTSEAPASIDSTYEIEDIDEVSFDTDDIDFDDI